MLGYVHLLFFLSEIGYVESNGMALAPLSFREIQSWSELTKTNVTIFEVESIRRLSLAYVDQAKKAKDKNCPPPYSPDTLMTVDKRKNVDSFFRNLARKKTK